jgi:hypothetical protein
MYWLLIQLSLSQSKRAAATVNPVKVEQRSRLFQREKLFPIWRRPTEQGQIVLESFRQKAQLLETPSPKLLHPVLESFFPFRVSGLKEKWANWGGFRSQERGRGKNLLGGIADVIFAANHMGDAHVDVIHHHRQVVERVAIRSGNGPCLSSKSWVFPGNGGRG